MLWESYREMYWNYELSLNQTSLFIILGAEVLGDFPKRLPDDLRKPFEKDWEKIRCRFGSLASEFGETGEDDIESPMLEESDRSMGKTRISFEIERLSFPILRIHSVLSSQGNPPYKLDPARAVLSVHSVMLFAHLDAFMADSLRTICQVRPEVMKKSKTMEWSAIISCGGWQELISLLTEKYILDFGHRSITKRVEFLRQQFRVLEEYPEMDIRLLEEAELVRHIVVHNGGKISQEYIDRTGRNDLAVGDLFPVTLKYVDDVSFAVQELVSMLYIEVSEKFFGKKKSEIRKGFSHFFRAKPKDSSA